MLTLLRTPHWLSLHGLIVVLGLLIYVVTTHTLQQRRAPAAAISWVLTIALIPYLGLPLYLLFGTRKLPRSGAHPASRKPDLLEHDPEQTWPRQLAASMHQPPVVSYRHLHVHADGTQALKALWDVIDQAEQELMMSTFLIGRDATGKALMARLIDKARSGVRVCLLIDGLGRFLGGNPNLRRLKEAGVQVRLYSPPFHISLKTRTNLRNHRKMTIADGKRLWTGGRNVAAEYFEGKDGQAPWRDLSFDLEGPLAMQARALFEHDWAFAGTTAQPQKQQEEKAAEPFAQVIASGPDQTDDTVHDILVTACFKASKRILAVTPYFVPSDALLMALSLAARRNVEVDLILPHQSNHRMADFARHRALRALAAAGARIWQVPYMLHAKSVVIDDFALAGSVNLDGRSLFLNYEMMIAFYAPADVQRFSDFIDQQRAAATRYHAHQPGLWRDFTEGLVLWLAFQL